MPKIQMRRDTAGNWTTNNPTLLSGEWALETDTRRMKIGDGTTPYNTLPYNNIEDMEWVKPTDWPDIRSGAITNSIYFLVGHNNTYPTFSVNATVSNSGTYDVIIDGIKQFTTASGATTVVNWATLNLQSGYDVTYPETMRTHIVRVTPTTDTNELSAIHCTIDGGAEQAVLWAHFTISNAINLDNFLAESGNSNRYNNRLCEAVTAEGDEIAVTSQMRGAFRQTEALKTIPKINLSGETINAYRAFTFANKLKTIRLKNGTLTGGSQFFYSGGVEKLETENMFVIVGSYSFSNATNLKELPPLKFDTRGIDAFLLVSSVGPTFLDLSSATGQREIRFSGSSTNRRANLIGITVSNSAPFDGSSPQITLINTTLDKNALVNLFNSLPTVSASQVCNITGATGAADLTAADLAIATNKGWTVTR